MPKHVDNAVPRTRPSRTKETRRRAYSERDRDNTTIHSGVRLTAPNASSVHNRQHSPVAAVFVVHPFNILVPSTVLLKTKVCRSSTP